MVVVLEIERESAALRYRLVDEERAAVLAEGAVTGIGMPTGEVVHTVRVIAEPGVPSVTMVSETARTSLTVVDENAAVDALLTQFAEHGPELARLAPRVVGDDTVIERVRRSIRRSDHPFETRRSYET